MMENGEEIISIYYVQLMVYEGTIPVPSTLICLQAVSQVCPLYLNSKFFVERRSKESYPGSHLRHHINFCILSFCINSISVISSL